MINNDMDDQKAPPEQILPMETAKPAKTPDELSGVYFQSHIKIFDPESQEIYFAGRA